MARSKSGRKAKSPRRPARKAVKRGANASRSSAKRRSKKPAARTQARKKTSPIRKQATSRSAASPGKTRRSGSPPPAGTAARTKPARLDRERRHLEEDVVPTPPSSLNMNRRGSAARTGRAELNESRQDHRGMTPAITGGDVDVDVENAYFSGDEAPGGDNPTPDQDVVDDIGKALGVEYDDNEELKASDKLTQRDRHRWELDPASSEDYKDRK